MKPEELEDRLSALHDRLDKASARPTGRRRIPGDGDGDGIPNEGKKPGAGGGIGSAGKATMVNIGTEKFPFMQMASAKLPKRDADGATHHVPGYKADVQSFVHEGKPVSFVGTGKNLRSGKNVRIFESDEDGGKRYRIGMFPDGRYTVEG